MNATLDIDLLRTMVAGVELGSFARAAERLGRTQSAVSLQLQRLESQAGARLFQRRGRGLGLTARGELVLGYARRILALNDEAMTALGKTPIAGTVRLGLTQDFAETWLPRALARFGRAHPGVQIDVRIDRSAMVADAVARGRLDLGLAFTDAPADPATVAELKLVWIGDKALARRGGPLPLVLFEPPCLFNRLGTAALERAGLPWRLAVTSPSLAGLWAAVDAGLGVTVRSAAVVPAHLRRSASLGFLPSLPSVRLALLAATGEPSPAAAELKQILVETLRIGLGRRRAAPGARQSLARSR